MQDKLQNTNYIVFDDQTVFSYARLKCDEIVAFVLSRIEEEIFLHCFHHSKPIRSTPTRVSTAPTD